MDFGFSDEQEQLREAVREFFARETPVTFAREMADDDAGITPEAWAKMAELGWLGITVPGEHGGSGLGVLELAIVLEEAGGVVLPGPLMSTLALAVPAVTTFGTAEQASRFLPAIAAGSARATVALAEQSGVWGPAGVETTVEFRGEGLRVAGTKLFVPDARGADTIFVVGRCGGADTDAVPDAVAERFALVAVPADAPGVSIEPMQTVDLTRKLDVVVLDDVRVDASAMLGGAAVEADRIDALVDVEKVALAAELCGGAAAALALSVDYLQIREQFGRKLATFQALQHKLADMKVALENSRSLTYYAAWAIDNDAEDRRLACAMAKAYAGESGSRVVADAIQAHGGVGFTWEHDLHLYLKRAKADEALCGDPTECRELVARLLEL